MQLWDEDHLAVHHEKNLHVCGDDPQGPSAGMPRVFLVVGDRLELDAASSSLTTWRLSTTPTLALRFEQKLLWTKSAMNREQCKHTHKAN